MPRTYHTYTTGEEELIRNCWGVYPVEDIAREIGISVSQLRSHAQTMRLDTASYPSIAKRSGMRWADHELKCVRLMAGMGASNEQISNALQRSVASIARIKKQEGIVND